MGDTARRGGLGGLHTAPGGELDGEAWLVHRRSRLA